MKNFTEKPRIYIKLIIAIYLQLKFELILTDNKSAIDKEISTFSNGRQLEYREGLSSFIKVWLI